MYDANAIEQSQYRPRFRNYCSKCRESLEMKDDKKFVRKFDKRVIKPVKESPNLAFYCKSYGQIMDENMVINVCGNHPGCKGCGGKW